MRVIVSSSQNIQALQNEEQQAPDNTVFECRLDLLTAIDLASLSDFINNKSHDVIFTLRRKSDGGHYDGSAIDHITQLKHVIALKPEYLDIEHDIAANDISTLKSLSNSTKLIHSFHDFNSTPTDLENTIKALEHPDISIIKIATMANNTLDALRLAVFLNHYNGQTPLSAHAMGDDGQCTRIMAPVLGSYFVYTTLEQNNIAPGLINNNDLESIYNFSKINKSTQLFALLGHPINHSSGHIFHNRFFNEHNINALYLKLDLKQEQCAKAIDYIKQLPFKGLSVTMPLKIKIKQSVDTFDQRSSDIGAVNTIRVDNNKLYATNTDAPGALLAIKDHLDPTNKHIVILGAGGAARAIAYEAKQQGAKVTVINRTLEKAQALAQAFDIKACDFANAPQQADILINTLPESANYNDTMQTAVETLVKQQPFVMNINHRPENGPLDLICKQFDVKTINGLSMYQHQALIQQQFWSQ